jgi:hypothetical protein
MRYVHAVDRDLETAIDVLEMLTQPASTTDWRPASPSRTTSAERDVESERRPILSSRGGAERNVESEQRPTIDMGAA